MHVQCGEHYTETHNSQGMVIVTISSSIQLFKKLFKTWSKLCSNGVISRPILLYICIEGIRKDMRFQDSTQPCRGIQGSCYFSGDLYYFVQCLLESIFQQWAWAEPEMGRITCMTLCRAVVFHPGLLFPQCFLHLYHTFPSKSSSRFSWLRSSLLYLYNSPVRCGKLLSYSLIHSFPLFSHHIFCWCLPSVHR